MSHAVAAVLRPTPIPASDQLRRDPAAQAFLLMRIAFTVAPIVFEPDGTAADNLPWFMQIVRQVWAGPDQVKGRAYVDALVAGGFDKAAMQVTKDESTVGNPAESIQFSVLWKGECLVGQVGPATGDPVAVVLPELGTGTCLLGETRPIDW